MLEIDAALLADIHRHGEEAYPEEGAGLLLGSAEGERKRVKKLVALTNAREDSARHNRYLLTAEDFMRAEDEAARDGLDIIGVFHSHPDHPNHPSDYDLEWAMPWLSYLITSVQVGQSLESRSWKLSYDRSHFVEEIIVPVPQPGHNQTDQFA